MRMIDATVLAIALTVIGAAGLVCGFVAGWHWRGWRDERVKPRIRYEVPKRVRYVRYHAPGYEDEEPGDWESFLDILENRR